MTKKILIIGQGGREHALGWKLAQSKNVSQVFYASGNAGTEQENKSKNIAIESANSDNFPQLADFIKKEGIDLTVIGPEAPLADGIVDYLNSRGYDRVFGPTKRASLLESDKFYSYDIMNSLNIPQANSIKCHSTVEAIKAIKEKTTNQGIVIKARGLTQGKGVTVCDSKEQALSEIGKYTQKYGEEVLIAERLFGQEFSVFGISDGNQVLPIEMSVQDHKPLLDDDKGPNTGGMGAYCPAPIASAKIVRAVTRNIMTPVVEKMKAEGNKYQGFLYAGIIMTKDDPKVIEFNIRFGDPEAEPAMMMIKSDLYQVLSLALQGKLEQIKLEFNPGASCSIVLASQGYPEKYQKGLPISGLSKAEKIKGVKVFHAGTKFDDQGLVLTNGGRVLAVTGYSEKGIRSAQKLAYQTVKLLDIPGGFSYRTDIANKALNTTYAPPPR